jgi:hypothetical protein
MVEIALVTQAIGAASAGLKLIDQIADQVTHFIEGRRPPPGYREHAMTIEAEGDKLVSTYHGQVQQVVTAEEMEKKLQPAEFRHIKVLEQAMENHYNVWSRVYPHLATMDSPVQKAKVEAQLDEIVQEMKKSLVGILDFLETCGFYLDDHYQHVRHAVATA